MSPEDVAAQARKRQVPWDEVRAARVQRRVLAEVRAKGSRRPEGRAGSLSRPLAWAVAATALIAALVLIVARLPRGAQPTRIDFEDGSFVVQGASARVVPGVVTPDRIELHQSAGSASYEVAPRPERTFVVLIDDVRVEVLGTIFRVEKIDTAVRVSVQRGHVQVHRGSRTVSLVAGEEVTLGNTDPGQPPEPPAEQPPSPTPPATDPAASAAATGTATPEQPPAATAAPTAPAAATTTADDPGPAELFRRADSARAAGDTAEAIRLLNQLVARHPRDGRATLAVFTIARLEAQRGNHARAAATFESLGAALGGEALAEAALAHAAAGQSGKARTLATRYTSLFPDGPRARQLARLVE